MNAAELARQFSAILHQWLTPEDFKQINAANLVEVVNGTSICHTHDFCDPNQAMIDALQKFGVEIDIQNEEQVELINKAWKIAKDNQFNCLAISQLDTMENYPPTMC